MLAGPVQGGFFELLVHASGAKRILEIGTFTGYSSLSMAAALPEDGHIDTLEIEPRNAEFAQRYFDRSPHGSKITLHVGPAIETMRSSRASSTSSSSTRTSRARTPTTRPFFPGCPQRGLIAIDNTLWSGDVLDPQDERTNWIVALNDKIAADDRVVAVLLTVRDGITLIRRR